jgi:hypothetical protein
MARDIPRLARKFDDFALADLRILLAALEGPAVTDPEAAALYEAIKTVLDRRS